MKSADICRKAALLSVVASACSATADVTWSAVWTNAVKGVYAWTDAVNWKDGYVGGTDPSDNVDLASCFPEFGIKDAPSNWGHGLNLDSFSPDIHSVTGRQIQTIYRAGERSGSFTVADPSPFLGLWFMCGLNVGTYNVDPESGKTPEFRLFGNGLRSAVNVAEGGKVRIANLLGSGMTANSGPGELVVSAPRSLRTRLVAEGAGPVTIESSDGFGADSPAPGAYWRLDASEPDTFLTVSVPGDDRTYVTNWFDADGRNAMGFTQGYNPFISEETFNGLHMLDFGGYIDQYGTPVPEDSQTAFGPAAFMYLSEKDKETPNLYSLKKGDIYEAFVVIKGHTALPADNWVGYLGTGEDYSLCTRLDGDQFVEPMYSVMAANHKGDGDHRMWLDGQPRLAYMLNCDQASRLSRWNPEEPHVIAFSFGEGSHPVITALGATRSRKNEGTEIGGFMMGEALVYTNRLSEVDRRRTIDYLRGKWLSGTDAKPFDLDAVIVANGETAVKVEEGDHAKVRTVRLANNVKDTGVITKKGGGTLEIENVIPSSATIDVRGGDVMLSHDTPAASVSAADVPLDGMLCWLDAENSPMIFDGTSVTNWGDRREGMAASVFAEVYKSGTELAAPTRVADPESGLHVIDFGYGIGSENPSGVIKVNGSGMKGVAEMFVVWRRNCASGAKPGILWDGGRKGGLSSYSDHLFTGGYNFSQYFGALLTVDGEPRDTVSPTIKDFSDVGNGELSVVNVSSVHHQLPEYRYLAFTGWTSSNAGCGGCVYGEVICYGRTLSDAERRNVTGYLLSKWKNGKKTPLDADDTVSKIAFADGVTPTVGTRTDRTVRAVTGSGTFVKKGAGGLTVNSLDSSINGLDVREGTLSVTEDWMGEAIVHFDASDETSIEFADDAKTQVRRWKDVRGNGLYAEAYFHAGVTNASGGSVMAYPEYKTAATGENGLAEGRPYIDFHAKALKDSSTGLCAEGASSMLWYNADGTRLKPENIREAHIVYMDDVVTGNNFGTTLSWAKNDSDRALYRGFMRFHAGAFYYVASGATTYTDKSTNLVEDVFFTDNSFDVGEYPGFRVHSIQTVTGSCADSFYIDRDIPSGAGGGKLCEVILFDSFSDTNRWMAVYNYLKKKWKGLGEGTVPPAVFDSVNVAEGASLRIESLTGSPVSLASVTGTGTVEAESLAGVGTSGGMTVDGDFAPAEEFVLKLAVRDDGSVDALEISGEFDPPSRASVLLSIPDGYMGLGIFRIVGCGSLSEPIDIAKWTLAVDGETKRVFSLSADGNGVLLHSARAGLKVILR